MARKKHWTIRVSQNGWEYTSFVHVECDEIVKDKDNDKVIYADGMRIEFDEQVGEITFIEG